MRQLQLSALPDTLAERTVLDIGGYEGEMAALCLERGATRAVVVDNEEWRHYGWGEPGRRPGVEYVTVDFLDYAEPADLVVFYNVLYHLKDPWAGLDHVRALTRWQMMLCTSFVGGDGWQAYPDGMGHPNGTVWWRPSPERLVADLHAAGFAEVEEVGRTGDHLVLRCCA